MVQQTAVRWLLKELRKYTNPVAGDRDYFFISIPKSDMVSIREQTKQMEKEQALELADKAYEAGKLHQELSKTFDDPKGRFISYIKHDL